MPYYVQKSGGTWSLSFRLGTKIARNVPKKSAEAASLGFRPEMGIAQAKAVAARLQATASLDREAAAHGRVAALKRRDRLLRSAFLTDEDAAEFEATYLLAHKIRPAHWSTLQRIIVGIALHPREWFALKPLVYAEFHKLRLSFNYAKKLLRYLNIWGYYLCNKQNVAWKDVPRMDGTVRNRLEAARKPGRRPSLPLSYQQLRAKRSELAPEHYGWLLATVAFGLRPEEADQLAAPSPRWYVYRDAKHKVEVLAMFQKKLHDRGTPVDDCWKHIPAVESEQVEALACILAGVARPIGRAGLFMRDTFGEGYSHYAGRNNFSGWLCELGYDPEARRRWMGHLSSATTEAYDRKTSKGLVFFKEPARKRRAG